MSACIHIYIHIYTHTHTPCYCVNVDVDLDFGFVIVIVRLSIRDLQVPRDPIPTVIPPRQVLQLGAQYFGTLRWFWSLGDVDEVAGSGSGSGKGGHAPNRS